MNAEGDSLSPFWGQGCMQLPGPSPQGGPSPVRPFLPRWIWASAVASHPRAPWDLGGGTTYTPRQLGSGPLLGQCQSSFRAESPLEPLTTIKVTSLTYMNSHPSRLRPFASLFHSHVPHSSPLLHCGPGPDLGWDLPFGRRATCVGGFVNDRWMAGAAPVPRVMLCDNIFLLLLKVMSLCTLGFR